MGIALLRRSEPWLRRFGPDAPSFADRLLSEAPAGTPTSLPTLRLP